MASTPTRDDVCGQLQRQRQELLELLRAAAPNREREVAPLIKNSIAFQLRRSRKADLVLGATRFGGVPDLAKGTNWPTVEGIRRWEFVGQLRLEDLVPYDVHDRLPTHGLLTFFQGYHVDCLDIAGVWYFPADIELQSTPCPDERRRPRAVGVDIKPLALLPPYLSRILDSDQGDKAYESLFDEVHPYDAPFLGMFGYERPCEKAQSPETELLLRLDNNGNVPCSFSEYLAMYFFITREALLTRDFSKAVLHCGVE